MVLELIWTAGVVFCIFGLLCGAYLVLIETDPLSGLFGKNSAARLSLSAEDLRQIEAFARCGFAGHRLSGNAVIDREHQRQSDSMNRLRVAILSGHSRDEVEAIVDGMIHDLEQHFQNEEAILVAASFPGTAKHVDLHRELVNNAAAQAVLFNAGMLGIGKLFQFLAREVIAGHMLDDDREFIPYLASQR